MRLKWHGSAAIGCWFLSLVATAACWTAAGQGTDEADRGHPDLVSADPGIGAKTREVLPYQAEGYRYRVIGLGSTPPAGFEQPGFDDSSWPTGAAAFGSGRGCPLAATVRTDWRLGSELLVRRPFYLAAGAQQVRVMVSIDNDLVAAWLNGTRISGLIRHEDCPVLDEFRIDVAQELLRPGRNLLAVHARDRGGESFFDTRVLAEASLSVLSWTGQTGYLRDGVDPNRGLANDTLFAFKVKLTDEQGNEPGFVRLVLRKDGATWRTIDMAPRPGSTRAGRVYFLRTELPPGNYAYRFAARNRDGWARGEPCRYRGGPDMPAPPFLAWVHRPSYGPGDGVEPNSDYENQTFRFKVVCRSSDGDLPRYVSLHLWRDGSPHGTFTMEPPSPPVDTVTGLIYTLDLQLPAGAYEYQFEAADRHGKAAGPASVRTSGLTVLSARPTLSWAGVAGFYADGVSPNRGQPSGTYRFKVKLTDKDGNEPACVRLLLRRDGAHWPSIEMRPGPGGTASGRVYSCSTELPAGNWTYCFAARDEDGYATGKPTRRRVGPWMPAYPYLLWSRETGYDGEDGVDPNSGTADSTRFRFRVVYRSHDGDLPSSVRLVLWRNGSPLKRHTVATQGTTHDPIHAGITYTRAQRLPAGEYEYQFEAADWRGDRAVGPAAVRMAGPVVTSNAAATLTSLAALPTAAGTQIIFTLSSPAQVQARVLNIAGRPVRTLCWAKECAAGTNMLPWNAQSDSGLPVPNGSYLVEVLVRAPDGTQARALTQVRRDR
jgi:hypothetical protein